MTHNKRRKFSAIFISNRTPVRATMFYLLVSVLFVCIPTSNLSSKSTNENTGITTFEPISPYIEPTFTTYGGEWWDEGNAITFDLEGNIIITGRYYNTTNMGYGFDALLCKYSNNGTFLWSNIWGGSSSENLHTVAVDSNNNILIGGRSESFQSTYFCKYSQNGTLLWTKLWNAEFFYMGDLVLDVEDNIFVCGTFDDNINLDIFIAKFSSEGDYLWNTTFGGEEVDNGLSLTLDSEDNILVAGYSRSFGPGTIAAILCKFSSEGQLLWSTTWGTEQHDRAYSVAVDLQNNIYIGGKTEYEDIFSCESFICKYSSDGTLLAENVWRGRNESLSILYDLTFDTKENLFATGVSGFNSYERLSEVYICQHSRNFSQRSKGIQWGYIWGFTDSERGYGITIDKESGIIAVTGETNSFASAYDDWDMFLLLIYDADFDGVDNNYEAQFGTDPLKEDTDDDTYTDLIELLEGTDPLNSTDYPIPSNTTINDTFLRGFLFATIFLVPVSSFIAILVIIGMKDKIGKNF